MGLKKTKREPEPVKSATTILPKERINTNQEKKRVVSGKFFQHGLACPGPRPGGLEKYIS